MALNINRSRLNDSIQRMLSFYMQNKLGEMSQQRQLDTYAEQDRLMRERSALDDVQSRKTKEYESGINVEEYIKKAFIDTAKSNDAYDYNVRAGQVAKEAGDLARSKEYYGKAYELAVPNLTAKMNALKGKVDEKDFLATMEAFGEDGVEKIMSEAGTNARANQQLPIQQSQAATSAGNLALARDKEAAEPTGQLTQKEYSSYWNSKVDKAINFITGFKDAYTDPSATPREKDFLRAQLEEMNIKPTELIKFFSELRGMGSKASRGRLSSAEEAWIDKYGSFGDDNKIVGGSIPSRFGVTGWPSAAPNIEPEAGLVRPTAQSDPPVAPPAVDVAAPSIHTTGERKPYTDPKTGKQALYEWNGSTWIFVKAL